MFRTKKHIKTRGKAFASEIAVVDADAKLTQCGFHVTRRDGLELVAGLGIVTANSGAVKCRRPVQIRVGTKRVGPKKLVA